MNIPQIDLATIPSLEVQTGVFGSAVVEAAANNDRVVEIMIFIYETVPPSAVI